MTEWRVEFLPHAYPALTLACLGYPGQASRVVRAIDRPGARTSYVLAQGLAVVGRALIVLRDGASLRRWAIAHITLCEERGYRLCAAARCALGWLEAREGRTQPGLQMLRVAIAGDPAATGCLRQTLGGRTAKPVSGLLHHACGFRRLRTGVPIEAGQ